jgi:hypothetical protein
VVALRAERAAAAEEAHSAQQELQRVLREVDQCQKVRPTPGQTTLLCICSDACFACCAPYQLVVSTHSKPEHIVPGVFMLQHAVLVPLRGSGCHCDMSRLCH